MRQVWRVLRLLREAVVTLNLKQRELFAETIPYLGYVIRSSHPDLAGYTTDEV